MIGHLLGNYRVTSKLGSGGMGVVYAAEHSLMASPAAIKILLSEFSDKPEVVERFFNEARATTMIRHPGIVKIFDFGYAGNGSAYIVMELLEGVSVSERMTPGPMSETDAMRIARQAASALGAAHKAGIVHRDLKPENLILVGDPDVAGGERVKILDFGIAKLMSQAGPVTTRAGTTMGTPTYMAPEQCRGRTDIDGRADVYALGCVAFHMVCGRPPFGEPGSNADLVAVLGMHVYETPPKPRALNPAISEKLEKALLKCLAKKPEDRFQTMEELVSELDAISRGLFRTGPTLSPWQTPPMGIQTRPPAVGEAKTVDALPAARREAVAPTAPPSPTPTTLGGAVSIIDPPPGSRAAARWIAAVGAAALVIAAIAWTISRTPSESESAAAPAERPQPTTPAKPGEPSTPKVEPLPPQAPTPARKITIDIDSEPGEAEVFRVSDGVRLGKTPLRREQEAGDGELVLSLRAPGFQDTELAIALADSSTHRVVMATKAEPTGSGEPTGSPTKTRSKVTKKKRTTVGGGKREWGDLID